MATNTTNYNFIKPAVNDAADQDLWGGYLNQNWDDIDGYLKLASDSTVTTKTGNGFLNKKVQQYPYHRN